MLRASWGGHCVSSDPGWQVTLDEVRVVWCTTAALTEDAVRVATALLSPDEREHAQRLRFPDDARDYAVAHALLRRELSRGSSIAPAAWSFDRGEHGKPFHAGDGAAPAFSLSHTRGMVACAIAPPQVAIGVDVEANQRDLDVARLATRFFAAAEVAALVALPEPARRERFYDLWTVKEAVVKALGLALPPALARVTVRIGADGSVEIAPPADSPGGAWQVELFTPAEGYRLALAALRPAGSGPLTVRLQPDTADESRRIGDRR
jgi:4'-phosphopantetheinyl transferase